MAKICKTCGCSIPDTADPDVCPVCRLDIGLAETEISEDLEHLESSVIDRYQILERIGTGGFCVVYLAYQSAPVRRNVALKVLKPARIGEAAVGLFIAEQQAMAVMDHPNIAKIFDAGETESGAPYLVMELIKGEPITSYCARKRVTLIERIRIFRDVCKGVHHAHQNAVIHRDIKPTNVLVVESDDQPIPRIIDFGVAKPMGGALSGGAPDMTIGRVVGTPEYMPPEQMRGDPDIDTRADIYSLGVLLYELLTGSLPFSRGTLSDPSVESLFRMIQNEPPIAPSHRVDPANAKADSLTKLSQQLQMEPHGIQRVMRGDIDWTVMKALEKHRSMRYDSARALVLDLDAFLEGKPLPSRPQTLPYRTRKFVKRNRVIATTAGLAAVLLLAALVSGVILKRQTDRKTAEHHYKTLFDCPIGRVESVAHTIQPFYNYLFEPLQGKSRDTTDPDGQARANIVLINREPERLTQIETWLLDADPEEIRIVLGILEKHHPRLNDLAWKVLTDANESADRRLHAAAIAAAADPNDSRWGSSEGQVAGWLVDRPVLKARPWFLLLEPIAEKLRKPLQQMYDHEKQSPRSELVAEALAHFLSDDIEDLIKLAENAEGPQFRPVFEALAGNPGESEAALIAALATNKPSRNLSTLGLALLRMDRPPERVWEFLSHSDNPALRTYLIHGMAEYDVPSRLLTNRVLRESDPGVVSAILLALGDYDQAQLPLASRTKLRPVLDEFYRANPDSGVRSSAEWLLRMWGMEDNFKELDAENRTGDYVSGKEWYVTKGGEFTMVVLPRAKEDRFLMGSPPDESDRLPSESLHEEILDRTIAVSTKEVSEELFLEFQWDQLDMGIGVTSIDRPQAWESLNKHPGASIHYVSLDQAMLFCWWLTEREGLGSEQCYQIVVGADGTRSIATREGFLRKRGYRLPTEAEWEYACRAGTSTSRYYGDDDRLLSRYAWHFLDISNFHLHASGQLRPNAWGLFDVLGNVSEWCQEPYQNYYESDPVGKVIAVKLRSNYETSQHPALRGGSFFHRATQIRSALRDRNHNSVNIHSSFRVFRTVKSPADDR